MGRALADRQSENGSSSAVHRAGEDTAPVYPVATHTGSFDAKDPAHQHAATVAFGHWADGAGTSPISGLAGPASFELGDYAIGTTHRAQLRVFNTKGTAAGIHVRYDGPSTIALESSPEMLRPSRDGFDPASAIRLVFSPDAKGYHHGFVVISATWADAAPSSEQLRIPVRGAAHEIGEPDLADQDAAARDGEREQQAAAHDRAAVERAQKAHDDAVEHDLPPGKAYHREELLAATLQASQALALLLDTRINGVDGARGEAAKFERRKPRYDASLLEQLALAALDIATAGIAGALGKRIETALLSKLEAPAQRVWSSGAHTPARTSNPSKTVVAFFTDGVKAAVKSGGKALEKHGAGATTELTTSSSEAGESSDPVIAFFGREQQALIDQTGDAFTATDQARLALEPLLADRPMQAIAAMHAIAAQIEQARQEKTTYDIQRRESALHWVDYVAQTSIGATGSPGHRTSKIAAAKGGGAVNGGHPNRFDGLLDLEFTANVADAAAPITLQHVRLNGISQATADNLEQGRLLDTRIPLRAYGIADAANAALPLEAIRDESGRVIINDSTGDGGIASNWFVRKSGDLHGGHDAAVRGARKVLAELDDQFVKFRGKNGKKVETDSEDH